MPEYDIELKTIPSQLVASRRILILNNDEVPDYLGAAFDDVYKHLEDSEIEATGPSFALWHSSEDAYENEDVEAVFPIGETIDGTEEIQIYTLKEAFVATAIHRGKFDDFIQAHTTILSWIEENDYELDGPYREIYIEHDPSGESVTEVQFEVKKI